MPRSPGPSRRALLAGAATAIAAGGLGPSPSPRRWPPRRRCSASRSGRISFPPTTSGSTGSSPGSGASATASPSRSTTSRLTELRARADTEVATQQGHDLFAFPESPAAYEAHVTPLTDVVTECERRFGTPPRLRPQGHVQPTTQAVLRLPRELGPALRSTTGSDLWGDAGIKPDTWELVREGARKIREKRGIPAGFGLVARARQQHDPPRPPLGIRRRRAGRGGPGRHQLPGDDRGGQADGDDLPGVHDPGRVHVGRGLEQSRLPVGPGVDHPERRSRPSGAWRRATPSSPRRRSSRPRPRGPPRAWRRRTCSTATCSGSSPTRSSWPSASWSTSWRRPTTGSARASSTICRASPGRCTTSPRSSAPPRRARPGSRRPAQPGDRYALLAEADRWSALPGHPGHVTPAIDETLQRGIIPLMFARAARGEQTPEASVRAAEAEMRRIFARWSS